MKYWWGIPWRDGPLSIEDHNVSGIEDEGGGLVNTRTLSDD